MALNPNGIRIADFASAVLPECHVTLSHQTTLPRHMSGLKIFQLYIFVKGGNVEGRIDPSFLRCTAHGWECKHVLDCPVFMVRIKLSLWGRFYFHHNFDGDDLPVLMVKIKFTPYRGWFHLMVFTKYGENKRNRLPTTHVYGSYSCIIFDPKLLL